MLQDAGGDPIWNCEGRPRSSKWLAFSRFPLRMRRFLAGYLPYNGEVALEISVWDYDHYNADDLVGTGVVQVEQFCNGFEGMIPLSQGLSVPFRLRSRGFWRPPQR